MRNRSLYAATVALTVLTAAQAAVAGDAASTCRQLRASGAADIAKATLALRAKLPRIPAGDAAAFERENAAGAPDVAVSGRGPFYHVWLAGRYLDLAARQIGTAPGTVAGNIAGGTSLVLRSLMLADSANTAAGYVAIATDSLLLAASQRGDAAHGGPFPVMHSSATMRSTCSRSRRCSTHW